MRVRVLFFGRLKDIVGRSEEDAELSEGARVEDFLDSFPGVTREQVKAALRHAEHSLACDKTPGRKCAARRRWVSVKCHKPNSPTG